MVINPVPSKGIDKELIIKSPSTPASSFLT
jgi:hypothetical protein